jgi:dTMP kinase
MKVGTALHGYFITFEGIEGSGKTTQIKKLAEYLRVAGYHVLLTREPGDGEIGGKLRELLLSVSSSLDPLTELFLLAADRTRHVIEIIEPALRENTVVISDRYADSSVAYQGYGRGLDLGFINRVNQLAINNCIPDMTIVLDINPEISLERSRLRLHQQNMFDAEGRFEQEHLSFHQRVRRGFLTIAKNNPERCRVFDASVPPNDIFADVSDSVVRRIRAGMKTVKR